MRTPVTSPVASAPTHRAFFPGVPGAEILFDSKLGLDPVTDLVRLYPQAGVPKIEPLKAQVPADPNKLPLSAEDEGQLLGHVLDLAERGFADVPTLKVVPEGETEVQRAERIGVSGFGVDLVVDDAAKVRIEAQHAALNAAGIKVDASEQLYATGTRMAETQEERAREHSKLQPLHDAAEELRAVVLAERREDLTFTARELSERVESNGKLRVAGYALTEQAIRGLLFRCDESPATKYVFGLRARIVERLAVIRTEGTSAELRKLLSDLNVEDKAKLAEVLRHELRVAGDAVVKLRTRAARQDAFAAVSPGYVPADAPEVVERVLAGLPRDAKGSWSYDPATTSWELRADVWTPTPVAEQAVGEPFRGYASFQSRDNGTGSLKGGGGIELLRCLNASTYVAEGAETKRRHTGGIVAEVEVMVAAARRSVDVLCAAWGVAREAEVKLPAEYEAMVGLTPSQAIQGFWWGTLSDRKCELANVLPGRTKAHVAGLTDAYFAERRDPARVVRADFAQAWTRYVQDQPTAVRREAEAAIADWTVSGRVLKFDLDRVEV